MSCNILLNPSTGELTLLIAMSPAKGTFDDQWLLFAFLFGSQSRLLARLLEARIGYISEATILVPQHQIIAESR